MSAGPARPIELPVEGLGDGDVHVRLMADADVAAIVRASGDPAIRRFTTVPSPYSEEDARSWSERSAESAGRGAGIEAVIADERSGEFLGTVGIRRHASDPGRWSMGYLVAPEARGRGVATRAIRLVCRWAFEELGAERIEICAEPENVASRRVAERAGFRPEGLLRAYELVKGVRRDMVMHSLLPGELPS